MIAFLPARAETYFQQLAPDFDLIQQDGPDLGARLDNAISSYLSRGYQHVVIMNSDSPTLPSAHLSQAFIALESGIDVVLGPCDDGGYYLIGVKWPVPFLLRRCSNEHSDGSSRYHRSGSQRKSECPFAAHTGMTSMMLRSLIRLAKEVENDDQGVATHTRRFMAQHGIDGWLR